MNIQVPSVNLLNALKKTVGLVKEKHSIPILSYFLFLIKDNTLNIIASSADGIKMSICVEGAEFQNSEDAKICVPVKIKDIMDTITDESVILEFEGDELIVNSLCGRSKVVTIPANATYPEIEFRREGGNFTEMDFPANHMLNGINLVSFACSTNTFRPVLQSVHFEINNNTAKFVGTDSTVMALYKANVLCPNCEINIKSSHANLLKLMLKDGSDVKISCNQSQIKFTQGGDSIILPTIEGRYPDFNKVLPNNFAFHTTVKKLDLGRSLSRVRVCINGVTQLVKMAIVGEKLVLSGEDISFGTSAEDSCDCSASTLNIAIGLNANIFSRALQVIPEERIRFAYTEPNRPIIIAPESNDDLIIMCMPVTIQNA